MAKAPTQSTKFTRWKKGLPPIARVALKLLEEMSNESSESEAYGVLKISLDMVCRHVEKLCPKAASVGAVRAAKVSHTELLNSPWRRRNELSSSRDPSKQLHWEHYIPVSQMRRNLLNITKPTEALVLKELRKTRIVWITKQEDKKLPRSYRPTPKQAYLDAEIVLASIR